MRDAGYFRILAEEVGTTVQYVDTEVTISAGRILVKPYWEKTSLRIPLDITSAHPNHIHFSWPRAIARRLDGISSSSTHALEACATLVQRFKNHLADPRIVDIVTRSVPWRVPSAERTKSSAEMWLVLGFPPIGASYVARAAQQFFQDPLMRSLLRDAFGRDVQIALGWKRSLPSLVTVTRRGWMDEAGGGSSRRYSHHLKFL